MTAAVLVLENGQVFRGREYGAVGETLGEAVFCTAMTGYQETLTDPCLLYTSPSPRDRTRSRMPSSA